MEEDKLLMQKEGIVKKKWIIWGGLVTLILVLVISAWNIINNNLNSVILNIMVTPSSAKVMLGDKELGTSGEYRVRPGEYRLEVSGEGFVTETREMTLNENDVKDIWLYLLPTEENSEYYANNPEDGLLLGEIRSRETEEKLQDVIAKNPILNELPIEIEYYTANYEKYIKYSISYGLDEDTNEFVIVVTDYTGGNYENAKQKLAARGFDLDEYTIKYVDVTSESEEGKAF